MPYAPPQPEPYGMPRGSVVRQQCRDRHEMVRIKGVFYAKEKSNDQDREWLHRLLPVRAAPEQSDTALFVGRFTLPPIP